MNLKEMFKRKKTEVELQVDKAMKKSKVQSVFRKLIESLYAEIACLKHEKSHLEELVKELQSECDANDMALYYANEKIKELEYELEVRKDGGVYER